MRLRSFQSLSPLGIGCEALGGYNWGQVNIESIQSAILTKLERTTGNVLLDTADTYGPNLSEVRLGNLINGRSEKAFVATKFGVRLDESKHAYYDNRPVYIREALEKSLVRLRSDYIDLYQLHWHDGKTQLEQIFDTLEELINEGKIKHYGVCNLQPHVISPYVDLYPGLKSFSLEYNLLKFDLKNDISDLIGKGLHFIAYGCLAQGLLSGKYNDVSKFGDNDRRRHLKYQNFHGKVLQKNLKVFQL